MENNIIKNQDWEVFSEVMGKAVSNSEPRKEIEEYFETDESGLVGYSYLSFSNGSSARVPLTNFIIRFKEQVKTFTEGSYLSVFTGEVLIRDIEEPIHFVNFKAELLASFNDLKRFLHNLCGTKISISTQNQRITEAIKFFNRDLQEFETQELGFDSELTKFYTEELCISKSGSLIEKTHILYNDAGSGNYITLQTEDPENLSTLSQYIVDELLTWDEPGVMLPTFAFTFSSLIYPFIRQYLAGRSYMMLKGPSGCGKTTLARLLQQFFGEFKNLETWTSTVTSIQVRGTAYKDILYVVDDLKLQNVNEHQRRQLMTLIQNYSDETARNRANVNLELRDSRMIKGSLLISAEDLVITEASSIARGIILNVSTKSDYSKKPEELLANSRRFRAFTAEFIHFLLREQHNIDFKGMLNNAQDYFHGQAKEKKLSSDNLPRLVNNISQLYLSWQILVAFLEQFIDKSRLEELSYEFLYSLQKILIDNSARIQERKPEVFFEEMLWSMIENGQLELVKHSKKNESYDRDKIAGYYEIQDCGDIKTCIRLNHVYRKIKEQLRKSQEEIGHSVEAIKDKLLSLSIIKSTGEGHVSFGPGKTERGVYWLGNIPWNRIGINLPILPVTQPVNKTGNTEIPDIKF